jgi:hypothetical protein
MELVAEYQRTDLPNARDGAQAVEGLDIVVFGGLADVAR